MDTWIQLKDFAQNVFKVENDKSNEHEEIRTEGEEENKLFLRRQGFGWVILRFLICTLFYLGHLAVAIIFISFFVSAIAFSITAVLDMAFEMITPAAATQSKNDFLSAALFFLLCSLLIVICLMLSLFWEVLKVVLFKTAMLYNIARVVFLTVVLVASGIWVGIQRGQSNQVSFLEYVEFVSVLSWILAFVVSILGSIVLFIFVFTRSLQNKKILVVLIVTALIFAAFAVICSIAFGTAPKETSGNTIAFAFLLPFLTSLLVIYVYFRGKRDDDDKAFIFHQTITLLFLGALVLGIIVFTSIMNAPTDCTTNCKDEALKNAEVVDKTPPASSHYQICFNKWTSIELNIAELAFLANVTYHRETKNGNATGLQNLVNDFFKNRAFNWAVEHISTTSPNYFHLQYQNVSVIGIKGSISYKEFVESAKLWDEATVFQVLAVLVPTLNQLPTKFVAEYVAKASFINKIFHSGSNSFFFEDLENYIKGIKKGNRSEVILVGHSLGGGIAKIIGARLKISSVSFSSPGIAYGYVKFGFSLDDATKFGVSISPIGDIIPLLDKHVGLQQKINCNGKTFVQCHLMGRTYCELHHGCGLPVAGCQAVLNT